YAIAGTYPVTLAVTNSGGSSTKSKFVTLSDPPPLVASFTSQGDGLKVVFTDTSAGNPSLWTWDFGDNKSSTERNPQHTYASPGTYLVTLRIGGGGRSASTSVFVDVGGAPPVADFTFDISGLRVIFTDTSTGTPTSWRWDFGDQSDIGLTQSPIHTYAKPDIYTVTLTAANAGGMNSKTQFVPVTLGDKPVPSFKADVSGLDVVFTDTSTGTPTAWEWTFGDDSGVDTRQNPAHHYNAAKTYTVTLKVTNPAGSASINQFVKTLATPSAAFAYSLSSQDTLTASFVDLSTGSPTAWQWNFGDCADQPGCTSTMQNPVHGYVTPGAYSVTLNATNDAGPNTVQMTVMVGKPIAAFKSDAEGLQVSFINQSTNNPASYNWNFGDCPAAGCTSSTANPVHTYAIAGTYRVTLRATNAGGDSTVTVDITVP
ncbi:MAG TPA: PKD domain-containing protein, partial [Thermoanaerobaculia bacterium]